jgi:1,2-dihydroxy-3-keto-5-methylthiopentene dioxygenase
MTIEAWYMDDSSEDQRLEHRLSPNKPVSLDDLGKVSEPRRSCNTW